MKDTLLITGNGFDLALGLESSYQDFFNELYRNFDNGIDFEKLAEYCKLLREAINSRMKDERWEKYIPNDIPFNELNSFFDFKFTGSKADYLRISDLILYFFDKKHDQHFDLITSLLFLLENTNSRWFEVESNLKNIIHIIYSERFFESLNSIISLGSNYFPGGDHNYNLLLYNFIFNLNMPKKYRNEQITIYSGVQGKYQYARSIFLSSFDESLKDFGSKFAEFLNDQIKSDNNYEERAKELLSRISQATGVSISDETTNILNFNYTNFFKDYNTVNIHGSIDNKDIILGFDENGINDYHNLEYQYTKTYQFMARKANSIKILNNDINKIIIYGHSLYEADYSYFESIFDFYNIYSKPIDIYFCYPEFYKDDQKTNMTKTELQNAVINLVKNYGNTFDNKDHGKNLLHKLLIENRIHLAGVDQLELSDSSKS